jgi:hypothetical protein
MIVRSRDHCEIQRIRESNDLGSALLDHSDAFWRRVAQLDSVESCESVLLVIRDHVDVSRDRENEQRRCRSHGKRRVAFGVVPVALGIYRERRVDSDRDYVLVLIARFETGQQRRAVAGVRRVASHSRDSSRETLVVGDVCDVKTGPGVPSAIALSREPATAIPRRARVTVKIDHDVVRVVHDDRCHGPRHQRSCRVDDQNAGQRRQARADFTKN